MQSEHYLPYGSDVNNKQNCSCTKQVGTEFVTYLDDFASRNADFDAKELFTSFTLEVIANAGLGVQAQSFSDPNSIMRKKVIHFQNFYRLGMVYFKWNFY